MRKVDVPWGVNQVQLILLTIRRDVVERHGVALDGDAAFPLDVHRIEHLIVKLTLGDTIARLNQSIGQRRLAVVDMGDDAEVPDVFHGYRSERPRLELSLRKLLLTRF